MAIAVGLGSPMTALTWSAVTERPAAASDDAEASVHGIIVVDCRPRHVKDHQFDLHRFSPFIAHVIRLRTRPATRATTCSANPNESVIPAPPTPVIAVTAGAG